MDSINIRADDGLKLSKIFNDIEYSVFGIFLPSQKSKRLDIATGGCDEGMLMLQKRTKSSLSESEKEERVNQRQEDAFEESIKRLRSTNNQSAKGLKIMTISQLIAR